MSVSGSKGQFRGSTCDRYVRVTLGPRSITQRYAALLEHCIGGLLATLGARTIHGSHDGPTSERRHAEIAAIAAMIAYIQPGYLVGPDV